MSVFSKTLHLSPNWDMSAFLRWWGNGLLACLPAGVRRWLAVAPVRLVVEVRGEEVAFLREENEETREIDRYPLEALVDGGLQGQGPALLADAEQVRLRLPLASVLAKVISLPLAAETNLRQVVGFEIDRLTPFTANQVYYDVAVQQRLPDLKRLRIRFVAVSRALVEPLLSRLSEMGLVPEAVTVIGEDPGINLLPPAKRPGKNRLIQRLHRALLGLTLVLLATVCLLPLWQQRTLVMELLPRVATVQKEAEKILALRQELDNAVESSRFLLEKRREDTLNINLLNTLTALVPDGTWLELLEIRGNEVRMQGQSSQSSALVGLLEGSKWFHGATFLAPVTTDPGTGLERFYLSARIAQEP